LANKGKKLGD